MPPPPWEGACRGGVHAAPDSPRPRCCHALPRRRRIRERRELHEIGDAGDILSPQSTVGIGALTEIHGTIGDPDFRDAFLFGYDGTPGTLRIRASFDDPLLGAIDIGLFDTAGNSQLPTELAAEVVIDDLAAGLYVVGLALDDDGGDPPYTIVFDAPGEGGGVGFASVPEPAALVLVASGLAGCAALRRAGR